jgi:hypothetical protein
LAYTSLGTTRGNLKFRPTRQSTTKLSNLQPRPTGSLTTTTKQQPTTNNNQPQITTTNNINNLPTNKT